MHKTLTRFARTRGKATANAPPTPIPDTNVTATSSSPSANLLSQIRQQMQRHATAAAPVQPPPVATSSFPSVADPLGTHLVAATSSLPTPNTHRQHQSTQNKYASPYLAREAAKVDAQRSLGMKYRQRKATSAFDEIFPALGSGLSSWGNDISEVSGTTRSKRKYMELMPHLNPLAPAKAMEGPTTPNASPSIPQQRAAELSSIAAKMQHLWVKLIKTEFEAAQQAKAAPLTPLEREAALATGLEKLVTQLTDREILVAAKAGLLDIEVLSSQVGEEITIVADTSNELRTPATLASAVLPTDVVHELSHAATLSEWLTDASTVTLGGLPDDTIAPLLLRGQDPNAYGTFSEEEIQQLESFEASRKQGMGIETTPASKQRQNLLPHDHQRHSEASTIKSANTPTLASMTSNPLVGTNPMLHRLATLDPSIAESLFVMDRTRLAALADNDFQQALLYSNALYEREYQRQSEKAEMKPLGDEEVRNLQKSAGQRLRISLSRRQLDAAVASSGGSDGVGSSNVTRQRQRHIRQRYGNKQRMSHAVDMAKALRVLNPQSSIRPETATDVPYFFNPNTSIPPPSAGLNMPMPSVTRKGKRMVSGRSSKPSFFEE